MIRRLSLTLAVSGVCVLGFGATADAATTSLALPQGPAFAILGHSCGGIQEKPYAIGWSAANGAPIGDVYLSTTCGGSGRGGGGSTTYTAWAAVRWNFAGAVLADAKLLSAPKVNPSLSIYDARGDQLYNQPVAGVVNGSQVSTQAYVVVLPPASPANVAITPSGGQFKVTWTNDPTAPSGLISSSTVTATPVGSTAPVVTATANGNAITALIGPLQPLTTYQITVVSHDAGGSSSASAPVSITTGASAIPPGPPTGLSAYWSSPGNPGDGMIVSWKADTTGDSPTDQYQVLVTDSDTGQTYTQTVAASTLYATFLISDIPDYTVKVRAHDAAGWGAWSASYALGGA